MRFGTNKTKIVCTIGPSTSSKQMLLRLARAGMNVARLNLSHGSLKEQMARLNQIRETSTSCGVPLGALVDLPGPKIRVGKVSPEPVVLRKGSELTLTARRLVGNPRLVSITDPSVLKELSRGDSVFLADGTIRLTVEHARTSEAVCRVTRGGVLFSGK